jgi:hypothetical protein
LDTSSWFAGQLQATGQGFIWAAEQAQADRRLATPPAGLGEWPIARHVFHLLTYERDAALPALRYWLGGPRPWFDDGAEDLAWPNAPDLEALLASFREARSEQVALIARVGGATWLEARDTDWGWVSLHWVVAKTLQHTAEHLSDVLRIALFWDRFVGGGRRE